MSALTFATLAAAQTYAERMRPQGDADRGGGAGRLAAGRWTMAERERAPGRVEDGPSAGRCTGGHARRNRGGRRSSRAQETCLRDLEPRPVRATPETESARCCKQQALPMGKSGAGAPEVHHINDFPDVVDSVASRKR